MPILPPGAASIFDTVNSVLNAAKARLDDDIPSLAEISGKLLDKQIAYTQQLVNNAWRRFLEYCAARGLTILKQEVIISQFPVAASIDPAIPAWIDWFNCNDGTNLYAQPVLPPDLIIPLKIWERPSSQGTVFPRDPMELFIDGLPGAPKQTLNGCWEWRAQRIYMPGALQQIDFRILYARYLGDFVDEGTTQWFQQLVPIPRCQDPLSLFICDEIMQKQEQDLGGINWTERAEASARLFCSREVQMKQRGTFRKRSRSGRLEMGSAAWW